MREEVEKWMNKAKEDFDTAKYNIKGGKTSAGIINKDLLVGCEKLSFVYTETRYPDTENGEYTKEEIENYIKISEEIIKWVEGRLS